MSKGRDAFRTISEVADELELPQHVLRFWETKFNQIKPLKRGGNRRYYRPDDIRLLSTIRQLLHEDGFTIRGVQKLLKEQGVKTVVQNCQDGIKPGSIQAGEAAEAKAKANGKADSNASEEDTSVVELAPVADTAGASGLTRVHDQLISLRRLVAGSA